MGGGGSSRRPGGAGSRVPQHIYFKMIALIILRYACWGQNCFVQKGFTPPRVAQQLGWVGGRDTLEGEEVPPPSSRAPSLCPATVSLTPRPSSCTACALRAYCARRGRDTHPRIPVT